MGLTDLYLLQQILVHHFFALVGLLGGGCDVHNRNRTGPLRKADFHSLALPVQ